MAPLMKKQPLHFHLHLVLCIYHVSGESLIHMLLLTFIVERFAHKFSSVFVTISYLISIKLTTSQNGDKINVRMAGVGGIFTVKDEGEQFLRLNVI